MQAVFTRLCLTSLRYSFSSKTVINEVTCCSMGPRTRRSTSSRIKTSSRNSTLPSKQPRIHWPLSTHLWVSSGARGTTCATPQLQSYLLVSMEPPWSTASAQAHSSTHQSYTSTKKEFCAFQQPPHTSPLKAPFPTASPASQCPTSLTLPSMRQFSTGRADTTPFPPPSPSRDPTSDVNFIMDQVTSQIEKHFITSSVYKRSRRHFDIGRLNRYENQLQMSRRTPQNANETISSRLGESFVNSRQLLSDKVNTDINLYHKSGGVDTEATEATASPHKLSRTVDMRKMLAREYFQRKRPYHINEDQFKAPAPHSARMRQSYDFDKHLPRGSHNRHNSSELSPDPEKPGRIHEHIVYDQGNFSCLVDYKKYRKSDPKKQEQPEPVYEPSRVKKGEQLTTKRDLVGIREFYNGNGKNDPSQMDNKVLKDSEYFWKSVKEERKKFKDFSIEKRKEDERKRRLEEIADRKKLPDIRSEMCDLSYFRRMGSQLS